MDHFFYCMGIVDEVVQGLGMSTSTAIEHEVPIHTLTGHIDMDDAPEVETTRYDVILEDLVEYGFQGLSGQINHLMGIASVCC